MYAYNIFMYMLYPFMGLGIEIIIITTKSVYILLYQDSVLEEKLIHIYVYIHGIHAYVFGDDKAYEQCQWPPGGY